MSENLQYKSLKYNDMKVGDIFTSKNCGEYKVIDLINLHKIIIEFVDTGYVKETKIAHIRSGYIKDKKLPSVAGVGYLDGAKSNEYPQEYGHWSMMINRCYNTKYHAYNSYGGSGVTVCKRWHSFKNFVEDFKKIEGYSDYIMTLGRYRQLDKDIKQNTLPHNERVYSLETCTLIEMKYNQKYRRYNTPTVCFIATDPEGNTYYAKNVKEWCNSTGHYQKYINLCFNGKKDTYKGWKFKKITQKEFDDYYKNNKENKMEEI